MKEVSVKVKVSSQFLDGVDTLLQMLIELPLYSDVQLPDHIVALCKMLSLELDEKFEAINKRAAYSMYKTAPLGTEAREALRQNYLEHVGIKPSFRSDKEISV